MKSLSAIEWSGDAFPPMSSSLLFILLVCVSDLSFFPHFILHASLILSFPLTLEVHHHYWRQLSGSSFGFIVTVAIPAAFVCVCVNNLVFRSCSVSCLVLWAVSKSINMWKKRTSLWGIVHSFLVGSEVCVCGGQREIKRNWNKRKSSKRVWVMKRRRAERRT